MEINLTFLILMIFFLLFAQYVIIETAVRRGIDASETNRILEKMVKIIQESNSEYKESEEPISKDDKNEHKN